MGVANAGTTGPAAAEAPLADTTCLEESLAAVTSDPVGTGLAVVADPIGALEADLACVQEVLGL